MVETHSTKNQGARRWRIFEWFGFLELLDVQVKWLNYYFTLFPQLFKRLIFGIFEKKTRTEKGFCLLNEEQKEPVQIKLNLMSLKAISPNRYSRSHNSEWNSENFKQTPFPFNNHFAINLFILTKKYSFFPTF